MSIRTFIFCDICNTSGIRMPNDRRSKPRENGSGRRITDARAWFEGSVAEAVAAGWQVDTEGRHVCNTCQKRGYKS